MSEEGEQFGQDRSPILDVAGDLVVESAGCLAEAAVGGCAPVLLIVAVPLWLLWT